MRLSTDHPIFVWYTNGHDACVNSEALRIAGIAEDIGELLGGGHFGRGRRRPAQRNGLRGKRDAQIRGPLPRQGHARGCGEGGHGFLPGMSLPSGNTLLHEPGTIRSDWIEPFAELSNTLACRTSASVMFDDTKGLAPFSRHRPRQRRAVVASSLFSAVWRKIVGDGSNQTETGAQTKPYLNSTSKGSPNFDAALMKTDGRRSEGPRPAGADPRQRRLHDRHRARRDRGGLRAFDRLRRQSHRTRDDGASPIRLCA